jgi:hypothetical protein
MKLSEIQSKLQVPKTRTNSFAKYKYRNAEDILDAVKKVIDGNGTVTLSDEIVEIGGRVYVKATAVYLEDKDDAFPNEVTAYAREPGEKKGSDASQITGATSSYARKYALNGLFAIDDEQDADAQDNRTKPTNNQVIDI